MFYFTLFVFALVVTGGMATELIGYDCSHPNTNITAISLSTVNECKDDITRVYRNEVYVQVLQSKKYDKIKVISCLIQHSYLVFDCSSGYYLSFKKFGIGIDEVMTVSKEECTKMVEKGEWMEPHQNLLRNLRVNQTTVLKLHEAGDADIHYYCNSGSRTRTYKANGLTYENALVPSQYKITLKVQYLTWDRRSDDLVMASGQTFKASTGEGFDTSLGSVFWDIPESVDDFACTGKTHMLVYEGPAHQVTSDDQPGMVIINSTNRAMALDVTQSGVYCGYEGWLTSNPRIIVLLSKKMRPFKAVYNTVSAEEIDSELHLNAKLAYLGEFNANQLDSLYRYVREQDCQIRHQLLTHLTTIALISPDEFAWSYSKSPGTTAIVAGETVYLMSCIPVVVAYRSDNRCYQEMPVMYQNHTLFMKPRSRILVNYGTEIACNPLAPPLFVVNGKWIQLHSTPHEVPSPVTLHADPTRIWAAARLTNLASTGLYTTQQMEEYHRKLLFPLEQPAINQVIAYHAGGVDIGSQNVDLTSLFNQDIIRKYQESLFEKMYGWVWEISMQFAGFFGFLSILMIIKYIVNMIINGTFLYKMFGGGAHLLAIVLGSAGLNLIHLLFGKEAAEDIQREMEEEPLAPRPLNPDVDPPSYEMKSMASQLYPPIAPQFPV